MPAHRISTRTLLRAGAALVLTGALSTGTGLALAGHHADKTPASHGDKRHRHSHTHKHHHRRRRHHHKPGRRGITAPTLTITSPAATVLNATGWASVCGQAVCGTVTGRGVTRVTISVRQLATGRWFNGTGFAARSADALPASLAPGTATRAWRMALALPRPDGRYTIQVTADTRSGRNAQAGVTVTIDTTPPPAPQITARPDDPSVAGADATFSMSDAEAGTGLQCRMDGAAYQSCPGSISFPAVAAGTHSFDVRAVDPAGNVSAPSSYAWTVRPSTSFAISGSASAALAPGAPAQPLSVTITNSESVAIAVTALTATVQPASLPAGCPAGGFVITQATVSANQPLQVPAHGSVTLPAQGVSAPTLAMLDTHTNQDACQGAQLTLAYTGSAHS